MIVQSIGQIDEFSGYIAIALGSEIHIAEEVAPSELSVSNDTIFYLVSSTFPRQICYLQDFTAASGTTTYG